jgi:hypothetical protein
MWNCGSGGHAVRVLSTCRGQVLPWVMEISRQSPVSVEFTFRGGDIILPPNHHQLKRKCKYGVSGHQQV